MINAETARSITDSNIKEIDRVLQIIDKNIKTAASQGNTKIHYMLPISYKNYNISEEIAKKLFELEYSCCWVKYRILSISWKKLF